MERFESKRTAQFRLSIIKQLPKFPNNAETLRLLEQKSLGALLIDYFNWMHRLVPPRPRVVSIEPEVTLDKRWKVVAGDVKELLRKARVGEPLTPNLSQSGIRRGYTPKSAHTGADINRWADKDFLLNVMKLHHFHLSHELESARHAARTDELLFAEVTRDRFIAVGIFDHSVFDQTDAASGAMSLERERLWRLYDERCSRRMKPGAVYVNNPIATSGHTLMHSRLASEYAWIVDQVDRNLEDETYLKLFFDSLVAEGQTKFRPRWHFSFLDLGIFEEISNVFFLLRQGPI